MMQPNNIHSQKILEVFDQLRLSEEQIDRMEAYLAGEVGEEVLTELNFQDLSRMPQEPCSKLFIGLLNREHTEEAKKLFHILFTIGGSTCARMLPVENMERLNKEKNLQIEAAKIVALYAQSIGEEPVKIRDHTLKSLSKIAGQNLECIEKAVTYCKGKKGDGKLLLYTLYFLLKYPNVKLTESARKEEDSSNGGIILFTKENLMETDRLTEDDRVRMMEYENCLMERINDMLNKGLLSEEIRKIAEALYQKELTDEGKRLVKRHTTILSLVKVLAGCAFVNFRLSVFLRNFVSLCLSINRNTALSGMEAMDSRYYLRVKGGNFDEIFGFDTEQYINWAAEQSHKNILRKQFLQHRELFIKCCDKAPYKTANTLLDVIKEMDFAYYSEKRKRGESVQKEKIIGAIAGNSQVANVVKQYLREEVEIDQMIANEGQIFTGMHYCGWKERDMLDKYQKDYGDNVFYNRCQVYMLLKGDDYFFIHNLNSQEKVSEETKNMFTAFDSEKLDLAHQLKAIVVLNNTIYQYQIKEKFIAAAKPIFADYLLKRREEMIEAFQKAEAYGRCFALMVLSEHIQDNKEVILGFSQDIAKVVKEELLKILYQQPDWEEEVKNLLSSKKAAERELAVRVLAHWDSEKYGQELRQALEKEKNAKVRALIENVLQVEQNGEDSGKVITQEDLVKELHKGGRKRSLAWAYGTPFSVVHKKNGEVASEEYLQAIFLCYSSMEVCGVNQNASTLAEALNEAQFAVYANELFDKWMEAGAEAKKRWVLYAAAIHGGADIIKKLHHQIQEWPQHARGAIASDAVQALALNPAPQALLIVDGIARKFKFKQVKAAAGKALEFAASQLGLTREELADKIVPDLGFNENMARVFDYGTRKFTVTITTALEIEVFDESGKKLKNLPAPGKKDEAEKAAAAYEEYKQMKKQMKVTISSQKMRLELALSTEREWSVQSWKELFVKNPVMHQFAIGLIWGVYDERKLIQSFRYMEDGSFNTEEEDEFELPKNGKIGLVHPIELTEESRKAWKEQLEDYEIIQPIEQLNREIFYLTEEEKEARSLERFGGYIVNDLSLSGKMQTLGWYRGPALDGGGFYVYYREDAELGLGVELNFSGSFIGGGDMGDVTIYDARFYKVGAIQRGSYMYDSIEIDKGLPLIEIPERYFSEIVLQIARAAGNSKGRDENWKKSR